MIYTQTESSDLVFRIDPQSQTCRALAFDNDVILEILRRKRWSSDKFAKSGIVMCEAFSLGFLPQNVTYATSFDQTVNGWISYIRDQLYSMSETEAIYYTIDNKDVDLWILIPTRDFKLLRLLVELEMKVLDTISYGNESLYRLEFHIVYRNNANEETIVPPKAIRLSR